MCKPVPLWKTLRRKLWISRKRHRRRSLHQDLVRSHTGLQQTQKNQQNQDREYHLDKFPSSPRHIHAREAVLLHDRDCMSRPPGHVYLDALENIVRIPESGAAHLVTESVYHPRKTGAKGLGHVLARDRDAHDSSRRQSHHRGALIRGHVVLVRSQSLADHDLDPDDRGPTVHDPSHGAQDLIHVGRNRGPHIQGQDDQDRDLIRSRGQTYRGIQKGVASLLLVSHGLVPETDRVLGIGHDLGADHGHVL